MWGGGVVDFGCYSRWSFHYRNIHYKEPRTIDYKEPTAMKRAATHLLVQVADDQAVRAADVEQQEVYVHGWMGLGWGGHMDPQPSKQTRRNTVCPIANNAHSSENDAQGAELARQTQHNRHKQHARPP